MSLAGKVAVVTGGAKGIGAAIARRLAADGAAVSVWDRNEAPASALVDTIASEGGRAITCIGDASDETTIERSVTRTRDRLGPVSILVNNAGMAAFAPFEQISTEALDRMIAVNLKGPFLCTRLLIDDMKRARWGRIINITSNAAQQGESMMAHYVATKAALAGLTKALALEYAEFGITVNTVPPAFIDTPMLRRTPFDIEAAIGIPARRVGRPEEVAGACAYLASEAAGYVTGQTLGINGGRCMT